jgi:N-hydroxyarylamine O-acetyltransferase
MDRLAPANYFSSTHPDTIFVQKLLVILHTTKGREMLFGNMLKTVTEGRVEKQTIRPEDKRSILSSRFHLMTGA